MRHVVALSVFGLGVVVGCGTTPSPAFGDPDENLSAGVATVFDTSFEAFSRPIPNLTRDDERAFLRGRALFRDAWVTAGSSTATRDGLGPLFNAHSCDGCHANDGRGRPPAANELMRTMLIRLSVSGSDAHGGPLPEPTYGGQLQPQGILGVEGEGEARVSYEELPGMFADGTAYSLRVPTYSFTDLAYGEMHADVLFSPRVTPQMPGLGLLEAVPEQTLEALADPDDEDGDGISGRLNYVHDPVTNAQALGRFGWKANQPSLLAQVSGAFNGDMGLTSRIVTSQPCTQAQAACNNAPDGGEPEVVDSFLDDVVFYSRALGVPARRDANDAQVLEGKHNFVNAGCAACHVTQLLTGALLGHDSITLRPYTDLLLHDMGDALADGRPDFLATGNEWRTPPLWGLGLLPTINKHQMLLHDGRARNFTEAILWHGGEAQASREAFVNMTAGERANLVRFLESL